MRTLPRINVTALVTIVLSATCLSLGRHSTDGTPPRQCARRVGRVNVNIWQQNRYGKGRNQKCHMHMNAPYPFCHPSNPWGGFSHWHMVTGRRYFLILGRFGSGGRKFRGSWSESWRARGSMACFTSLCSNQSWYMCQMRGS